MYHVLMFVFTFCLFFCVAAASLANKDEYTYSVNDVAGGRVYYV